MHKLNNIREQLSFEQSPLKAHGRVAKKSTENASVVSNYQQMPGKQIQVLQSIALPSKKGVGHQHPVPAQAAIHLKHSGNHQTKAQFV